MSMWMVCGKWCVYWIAGNLDDSLKVKADVYLLVRQYDKRVCVLSKIRNNFNGFVASS
jgi:hypothetical protein